MPHGQTVRLNVDLGELPTELQVGSVYMGMDIASRCRLVVERAGVQEVAYDVGRPVFGHSTRPGTVDVKVTYAGDGAGISADAPLVRACGK